MEELRLDARRRSELVADVQGRLMVACPELTNGSSGDPAGTLIELFSWMTELVADRLAEVPTKLHLSLLDTARRPARGPVRREDPDPPEAERAGDRRDRAPGRDGGGHAPHSS